MAGGLLAEFRAILYHGMCKAMQRTKVVRGVGGLTDSRCRITSSEARIVVSPAARRCSPEGTAKRTDQTASSGLLVLSFDGVTRIKGKEQQHNRLSLFML